MKIIRFLLIIPLIALLACAPEEEKKKDKDPPEDVRYVSTNFSGKVQKGPCWRGGDIFIQRLNNSWEQNGDNFRGVTTDYYGNYNIPVELQDPSTDIWLQTFFDGTCHNEVTGGEGFQSLNSIGKNNDPVKNVNPLTTVRTSVMMNLFTDINSSTYQDPNASLLLAEQIILNYLEMPILTKRFNEMNLEQSGQHDAVLAMFNSMVLYNRSEAEQGDFLVEVSESVLNNNLTLKQEIQDTFSILPLLQITSNLKSRYAEFGMNIDPPPIYDLSPHTYYSDILNRNPAIKEQVSIDAVNHSCSIDQSIFNMFAVPVRFTSLIEASNYLASNFPKDTDVSIHTRTFNVYDRPGTELFNLEELNEVLLDQPRKLNYNGRLNGSLTAGDYYIVIKRDQSWAYTKACDADLLPFGRILASNDDGANWTGHDNNTPYHVRGIVYYTTD